MKTASMSKRRIRRVVLTKGCALASAAVPREKGLVGSECDDQRELKADAVQI